MHLAIRADGGPEIGYGHLMRSGAIAEELLGHGHAVTVATTTPDSAREVFLDAVAIVDLPSRDDPEPFVSWLYNESPDTVFTDAYPIDTGYQKAVREHVPLAVLQDDDRHTVCADLLVNGNLYAPTLNYRFVGESPETCLGTEYVPLRREIRTWAMKEPPWRETPERAVVTFGGNDVAQLTPAAVRAFDGADIRVDAIVGPGFSKRQEYEIETAASDVSADVRVARNPNDLPERLFNADFAVNTASSTVYELLALGTPFVCVPVAPNQRPIAAALRERGHATVLDDEPGPNAFRRAFKRLVNNTERRRSRREQGRVLVDGRGVERLRKKFCESFC